MCNNRVAADSSSWDGCDLSLLGEGSVKEGSRAEYESSRESDLGRNSAVAGGDGSWSGLDNGGRVEPCCWNKEEIGGRRGDVVEAREAVSPLDFEVGTGTGSSSRSCWKISSRFRLRPRGWGADGLDSRPFGSSSSTRAINCFM